MKLFKNKGLVLAGIIIIGFSFWGFEKISDKDFNIIKNLDVFYSLFREVNLFYVDDTDPEKLIETGINSMLESLDPYTVYIPESKMDDFSFMTTGKYGGIGSLIRKSGDYVMIAEPYEGSPSALSGLRAGDLIISVDNYSTKGQELSIISEKLKGDPNTEVRLVIQKPGSKKQEKITLIRKEIQIDNVSYSGMLAEKTGYIMLSNFTLGASREVENAFVKLKSEGAEKLILDLRGNPGGLLIEAVRICNLFVPKGELIVSTRGKVKQWDQEYRTQSEPLDTEIPIIVLVNRASASASEIVSGALQDLDRAFIVGQRTFGKGLVQTTRELKYNGQLKVTTAKYYIPSGRCIQALDYSNRNEDGSVGHIPDSLISKYTTKNGRVVYDGGGVQPDLVDTSEELSQLSIQLYINNMFFDFATDYVVKNPVEPKLEGFAISESDYEKFKKFVISKGFDYQTQSEGKLNDLIKVAKSEKFYTEAEAEILALREKLKHDNDKDLDIFKTEIVSFLNEEIISRYYFQKGRIKLSVDDDKTIEKSLKLLSKDNELKEILSGI
ncbi:MAG: S41 family peptidase [Bacteroidales bacterium]|nr:S41 family peptidase [Bacteroidales bacterium]